MSSVFFLPPEERRECEEFVRTRIKTGKKKRAIETGSLDSLGCVSALIKWRRVQRKHQEKNPAPVASAIPELFPDPEYSRRKKSSCWGVVGLQSFSKGISGFADRVELKDCRAF